MDHIKFASALGQVAAFSKFAEENPGVVKKKPGMSGKYKALLALLGGGGLAAGGLGAAHGMGAIDLRSLLGGGAGQESDPLGTSQMPVDPNAEPDYQHPEPLGMPNQVLGMPNQVLGMPRQAPEQIATPPSDGSK